MAEATGFADRDPYIREVRTFTDALMKKVPGLSTELPPKRSFITGQPIAYPGGFLFPDTVSPFAEKTVVPDVVLDELARLNHGFTKPGRNLTPRLELSPKQYDRFLELHGTIKLGGKTLKDRLQHEMEKDTYDIDRSRVPDGVGDFDDHRVTIVGRIISGYRKATKNKLLREDRELLSAFRQDKRMERQIKSGRNPGIQALQGQ